MKNVGVYRVAARTILEMDEILEEKGTEIAKYAVEIASRSGRKTIKESDIKLAVSKVF